MLNPKTLSDLNSVFASTPGGFVVVQEGLPKFVVMDYPTFQSLREQKPTAKRYGKILVTGGAGYIGAVTVRLLEKQGFEVVVFDNLSTGDKERVRGAKLMVGDLLDKSALYKVFQDEKIDAVIHFAASVEVEESVLNPGKYFQNNVVAGLNLLDAMAHFSVKKLVFSSSAAVYGDRTASRITEEDSCTPSNPYGETKLQLERILRWYGNAHGIHSVSLRYFNAAGAWPEEGLGFRNGALTGTHLIPRVLEVAAGRLPQIEIYGQDYETADGTCIRDYVHVLDLAEAHLLALRKLETSNGAYVYPAPEGHGREPVGERSVTRSERLNATGVNPWCGVYNVGTGFGNSVLEVIDEAVEVTGRMIPIAVGPRRAGDPAKLVADSKRLQRELDWRPRHALKSILESSWAWLQQNDNR